MRRASQRLLDSRLLPFRDEDPARVQNLKTVAQAFVQLQEKRQVADYHNGIRWTHTESLLAQEYLVSLLIKLRE